MKGKITIDRTTHPPTRSGHAAAKMGRFRGILPATPSGSSLPPPRVIGGFEPDPWVIVGTNGQNLSAFSCMALTLGQYLEPSGNTITWCEFSAVQTGFNYQSVDALLEITLYQGEATYYSGPMPINSQSQTLTGTYAPEPQLPLALCNGVAQYGYYISYPGSGSDIGPVVFDGGAYDSITGCSLTISGTWSPCSVDSD